MARPKARLPQSPFPTSRVPADSTHPPRACGPAQRKRWAHPPLRHRGHCPMARPLLDTGDTGRNGKGAPRVGWGTAESRGILALHSPLGSKEGPTPDPGPSWWPGPGAGGGERWLHAKARPPVLRRPWGPDAHALPPTGLPLLICAVSIPSATDSYGTTNK